MTTLRAFEAAASVLLTTTLLAGLSLAAGRVLRSRRGGGGPDARSLLYRATLCASAFSVLLVFAALATVRPAPLLRVPLPVPPSQTTVAAPPAVSEQIVAASPDHASPETIPASPELPTSFRTETVVFGVWLAGTLALLARLLVAHVHLWRLRGRAQNAADLERELAVCCARTGVAAAPLLLVSAHVSSPFLAGIFRTVLFVPTGFDETFDPDARSAIFAHELAHLRRRDCAWNLLARVVCALVWPQPLLWRVARRLEEANEEACDAAVVRAAGDVANDRRAYADCLVRLAEASPANRRRGLVPLGGAGVAPAFRSSLGRRVEHILKGPETMKSVSLPVRVCVAACALLLAAASVFLVSFSSPAPSRAAAQAPAADLPAITGEFADNSLHRSPGNLLGRREHITSTSGKTPPTNPVGQEEQMTNRQFVAAAGTSLSVLGLSAVPSLAQTPTATQAPSKARQLGIYVAGAVNKPGFFAAPKNGKLTVAQALSQAQAKQDGKQIVNIQIFSKNPNGSYNRRILSFPLRSEERDIALEDSNLLFVNSGGTGKKLRRAARPKFRSNLQQPRPNKALH